MTTAKLYTLSYADMHTYLAVLLFTLGNLALPQLFHLVPDGGKIWLPIYFFTLIGTYKYGWKVGVLTAVLSPVLNSLLFGMPLPEVVPAIVIKSLILAGIGGFVAYKFNKVTLLLLACTVLSYQLLGTLGEWALTGDLHLAIQDFRIAVPGMLLQLVGGYAFLRFILYK